MVLVALFILYFNNSKYIQVKSNTKIVCILDSTTIRSGGTQSTKRPEGTEKPGDKTTTNPIFISDTTIKTNGKLLHTYLLIV